MLEQIITGIVGMVCGNIMMFLLLPQKRKSEDLKNDAQNIENEAKQSEEWRKLYDEAHTENIEKDKKIDALYMEITRHRDEKAGLHIKITELSVENTRLKILKCEKPSCIDRHPPTGY